MNARLPLAILLASWVSALVLPVTVRAKAQSSSMSSPVGGQTYTEIKGWAAIRNLGMTTLKRDREEQVILANKDVKIVFKVDSLRATVNGIAVYLSWPVILSNRKYHVSQLDIDAVLDPILSPRAVSRSKKVLKVALSAGHGGKDPGFQVGRYLEKNFTLLLANEVQKLIKQAGLQTVQIRSQDVFIDLEEQTVLARRAGADLFVNLHFNSAGLNDKKTGGVETYCLPPAGARSTHGNSAATKQMLNGNRFDAQNMLLAYLIQKSLVTRLNLIDRGVRRARFVVLREIQMPAVLIEAGFMSQPEEMRQIQSPKHRLETARAIAEGILAYKRVVER